VRVVDSGEVSGDAWGSGDTASGDDGTGAGRERDTGMAYGLWIIERDATAKSSGDSVFASDTRSKHGACDVHGVGSGGAHRMRGDGMGVGHIGEVPGDVWGSGDTASGDDGRGAGRERDKGMMTGLGVIERDATAEPSRDSVGVGDDTRSKHGGCGVHGSGSGGDRRMRGDEMGVGHIGEVPCDTWGSGDTASGDDSRGAGIEHDTGMVGGLGVIECDATAEPSGDSVSVGDDTQGRAWGLSYVHGSGSGGTRRMRGNGLGVGHIGEVPGDAWGLGDMASGDDGRGAGRKCDAGMMTGLGVMERDATAELSGDSVGVSDDTRADHGACGVHRSGSGEAYGMRGDEMGAGHIGEVPGDT